MTEIERILIRRDGATEAEAAETLREMKNQVLDGEDPEEVLYEIGLEPDYIFDILDF